MRDGNEVSYYRATNHQRIVIPHAGVSLTGAITPGVFAKILRNKEYRDNGMLARFIFVNPPTHNRYWTTKEIPEEIGKALETFYRQLIDLREGDVDEIIANSPQAQDLSVTFYNEKVDHPANAWGDLYSSFLSKFAQYVACLALVFDSVKESHNNLISEETMAQALVWGRWQREETQRCFKNASEGLMDDPSILQDDRTLPDKVMAYLEKKGEVTLRDLCKSGPYGLRSKKEKAEAVVQNLVKSGKVEFYTNDKNQTVYRPCKNTP